MGVDNPVYNRTIEIRNWTKIELKKLRNNCENSTSNKAIYGIPASTNSYLIANPIAAIMIYMSAKSVGKSIIGNKEITRCLSD